MNILEKKHTDWPWPLSKIPRAWTAIPSTTPPRTLAGQNTDVPSPGRFTLQLSRYGFMFSVQTKGQWLFRIGSFRFDYVDNYYEIFTLTLKRHKP
jgi:hypothetical protein